MSENNLPFGIPQEFIDFVANGGVCPKNAFITNFPPLQYEIKYGEFNPQNWAYALGMEESDPDYPKENGYYTFPYVDLSGDEIIVWFPDIKSFGIMDLEHGGLWDLDDDWEYIIDSFLAILLDYEDPDYERCRTFMDEKIPFTPLP